MNEALMAKALAACEKIVEREQVYERLDDQIRKVIPEFTPHVSPIDPELRGAFLDVLDEVFAACGGCPAGDKHIGGEASYFVDECRAGEHPQEVRWKDKTFKLASTADLRAWIEWQRNNPAQETGIS